MNSDWQWNQRCLTGRLGWLLGRGLWNTYKCQRLVTEIYISKHFSAFEWRTQFRADDKVWLRGKRLWSRNLCLISVVSSLFTGWIASLSCCELTFTGCQYFYFTQSQETPARNVHTQITTNQSPGTRSYDSASTRPSLVGTNGGATGLVLLWCDAGSYTNHCTS